MGKPVQPTWWTFLRGVLRAPRSVGAIAPSSRWLVRAMLDEAQIEKAAIIVEFGPGTGVFTQQIIRRMRPDARLIIFEVDPTFAADIQHRLADARVQVINASAEHAAEHLAALHAQPVDCVVSGLPFASLPRPVTHAILQTTATVLRPSGIFVTFQYTPVMGPTLRKYFPNSYMARFVLQNLPPALVFVCPRTP